MITLYYSRIDEATAKRAKEAYSFFDYVDGSATESYKAEVDKCYEIACKAAEKRPNEEERIQRLFDRFVTQLADNINARNRNTASCPSVMIAGGSNFPVRKKEKQNARDDKLMSEYSYIMTIPEKIKSIGYNTTIYSNEVDAVEQLEEKAEKCRKTLESMKAQNAYYRKHGTMKGYGDFSDVYAERFDNEIKSRYSYEQKPFRDWELTSVREKMKAALKRVEALKEVKEAEPTEENGKGYTLVQNTEIMRIQFLFDEKPDAEIIAKLKAHGFKWAPSKSAWQRQLTNNGIYAAEQVCKFLDEK